MKKKQKNNTLLIIACVLSYLSVATSIILAIMLGCNILGSADFYKEMIVKYISPNVDVSSQLTMQIIDFGITALINLYFAGFYLKGLKYRVNTNQYGSLVIGQALFQILFASFVAGLFALIAGIVMYRRKVEVVVETGTANSYLSDYKMEAMSEAVRRLKELKEKGAISEEEYYASLNKILEN